MTPDSLKRAFFAIALAACALSLLAADESTNSPAKIKPKPKPVEHTYGPAAAQADMAKMIVAEGLEATLFASEPMLVNPCDMDVDERGRVWITEGANYRQWSKPPLRAEGDRIVILEDTDGDGKADKATTFYQGLDINSALGICVLGKKVIVSCAPNVFIFTDEDGDGKADKKEVLFTGIKGVQHDHAVHAFVFGPDGKLYFNFGYTDEMNGASWGTGWEKAKAKGASEEERPYYHWHQYDPGVVPNLLQTGNGSPCGICVYEGNLLPPIFRNQIIHCDAGPKIVR